MNITYKLRICKLVDYQILSKLSDYYIPNFLYINCLFLFSSSDKYLLFLSSSLTERLLLLNKVHMYKVT